MKLLFGNCSHSELPLIKEALKQGWEVASVGDDPTALLCSKMNPFFLGSYADPWVYDQAVAAIAPDILIPAANDASFRAILDSQHFDLAVIDTPFVGHQFADKSLYRDGLLGKYYTFPRPVAAFSERTLKNVIFDRPVAVKPVDSAGGKGVLLVEPGRRLTIS